MNIHIENLKCQQISPTVIGRGFFFYPVSYNNY